MKNSGKCFYVYIVTNCVKGTLYIGVTNSLIRRIAQHKNKEIEGFTKEYNLDRLVYYEVINDAKVAVEFLLCITDFGCLDIMVQRMAMVLD